MQQQTFVRSSLRDIPLFCNCGSDQLHWLAEQAEEVVVEPGEFLFQEGELTDYFWILLEGYVLIVKHIDGEEVMLGNREAGGFGGEVSLLLDTPSMASAYATVQSRILRFAPSAFHRMLTLCDSVSATILRTMSQRVQGLEIVTQQHQRLSALGKLSAGLAHELNNPAAAASRSSSELIQRVRRLQTLGLALARLHLSDEQIARIEVEGEGMARRELPSPPLDPVARSDLEDALEEWMEDHNIDDAWELAPGLAGTGVGVDCLDRLTSGLDEETAGIVVAWLESRLATAELLREIEGSTSRISHLVKAVKAYSYRDQAPVQDVDIHEGLETTLTVLGYKLKHGVEVYREYAPDLPRVCVRGSEINQVWTNLIDNAVDAMGGTGNIWIRTHVEGGSVVVEITDNGKGIAPDVLPHIFEPFYTTKDVGEGTGLGLDLVYRVVVTQHHGNVSVQSQPGNTRFTVRLPIAEEPSI